jgi:hypothetical protein
VTDQSQNSAAIPNEGGSLLAPGPVAEGETLGTVEGAQPNEDGSNTDAVKTEEGKKTQGAPAEYKEFTLAEGHKVDPETMGEFKTIAKELNLNQEQAQRLIELGGKIADKAAGPGEAAIVAKAKSIWGELSTADKEFGGDDLAANLAAAKKTLKTFGTPELGQLLEDSGLGNHPEVIRLFYRVGKQISDDKVILSGSRASGGLSAADTLYGTTSNKTP